VPVVLTTTNRKGAEALTGPGVLELLLKPYDIGQLLERLRAALVQRRAAREGGSAPARAQS
jgi:DNA-binding response OmpR family regulator